MTQEVQASVTVVSFALGGPAAEEVLLLPVVASQNKHLAQQRVLVVNQLLLLSSRLKVSDSPYKSSFVLLMSIAET